MTKRLIAFKLLDNCDGVELSMHHSPDAAGAAAKKIRWTECHLSARVINQSGKVDYSPAHVTAEQQTLYDIGYKTGKKIRKKYGFLCV